MSERDEFVKYFREIQSKFPRYYSRMLIAADMTLPQYALLNFLAEQGTMSMTEISGWLYISKPAVTSLVDRLGEHHFLKRVPHPSDRRIYLLQILPKGQKIVHEIQTKILNMLLQTLDQFKSDEKKVITKFYAAFSESVDQMLRESLKAASSKNRT